jgi:hypothetical protein
VYLLTKSNYITMNPTLEQFIQAQEGSGRKKAKWSLWKIGRKKVSPEEKRRRRFEGDTRPYSERNAHHRRTANALSYFFQVASISGAAYGAYRLFWDWSVPGALLLTFSIVVLWQYEKLARWTSDKFWDEYAAGRFDIRFALLNFGLIWSIGAALTLGGIYLVSNDTAAGPGGSVATNDPEYIAMNKQLEEAKSDVKKAEARSIAFVKDPNNLVTDNGKKVLKWNLTKQKARMDDAILTAEARVNTIQEQIRARYGVVAMVDADAIAYWLTVKKARVYAQIGLFFALLVFFEVCMWYRSKYDMMLYWEELYVRHYGNKPKSTTKQLNRRKSVSLATASTDRQPIGFNRKQTVNREAASVNFEVPPMLPDGQRYCKHDGCTEVVSGRKKFCCDSHKVMYHRAKNG